MATYRAMMSLRCGDLVALSAVIGARFDFGGTAAKFERVAPYDRRYRFRHRQLKIDDM